MAKPETNEATGTFLYRVNYQYIAPNSQLRTGAVVIDTTSAEKAKEEAIKQLANTNFRHPKIVSVKAY